MASVKGILTYLEHLDSKKESLTKAFLTLAIEWNDLDSHLDSTKSHFHECVIDLETREENLEWGHESLAESSRELDEVRESLNSRLEELDDREKGFVEFQRKKVDELQAKGRELGEIRVYIEERMGEFEANEERLEEQRRSMEALLERIECEKREFEGIQGDVRERLEEISLKERKYEELWEEIVSVQEWIEKKGTEMDAREDDFVLRERRIKEMETSIEVRTKEIERRAKECELELEKLERERADFEIVQQFVDERWEEMIVKEKSCEDQLKEINSMRGSVEIRCRELDSREEDVAMREERFRAMQKLIDERCEEIDSMVRDYELKEELFSVEKNVMEVMLENIGKEKKEIEDREKSVAEMLSEIGLKERNCEDQFKEANSIRDLVEKRGRELDSKEAQVVFREEQLRAVRKSNEERCVELNIMVRDCESKEERLSMEKKVMEVLLESIEMEKKTIEDRDKSVAEKLKEISLKERDCKDVYDKISLKERTCEDLCREINLIQDWTESQCRELYSKQEEFALREEQLKALEKFNEERSKELDVIAQEYDFKQEKINVEKKSVELLLEKIEKEKKEIEDINIAVGEKLNEISLKERDCEDRFKELNLMQVQIERRARELDSREEQVISREEQLKEMQKLNRECCEELDAIEQECRLKEEKLILKERNFKDRFKELNKLQDWIERRAKELDVKEEQVELREQLKAMQLLNVECKSREGRVCVEDENSFDQRLNKSSLGEGNSEDLSKKVSLIRNKLEKESKLEADRLSLERSSMEILLEKIGKEKKELDILMQELDSRKEMKLSEARGEQEKQLGLDKKSFNQQSKSSKRVRFSEDTKFHEENCTERESRDIHLKKRSKKNLSEDKQCGNDKVQQEGEIPAEIRVLISMDGRRLQSYLNEHYQDDTAVSKVHQVLQFSSDPGQLVLDAMEGFYPPRSKIGDDRLVTGKSCIILLEQLMILSPQIRPQVRERALRLAGLWKVKFEVHKRIFGLEVLGFILLLASYKLASHFDADEVLDCLEFAANRRQVPEICRYLGIPDKVPDLIKRLIRKNQHLIAVRFIVACELVKEFPPIPLLEDYLKIHENEIMARYFMENNSEEAQDRAIDLLIACRRNIIRCILNHKLECRIWFNNLEKSIKLYEEKKRQRCTGLKFKVKSSVLELDDDKFLPTTTAPTHPKGARSMLDPAEEVFSCLLAHMDGKRLRIFLSKHVTEHALLQEEVFVALRISHDPMELVLDAVGGFITSHFVNVRINIEESIVKTCIFLLEVLMRLSMEIKAEIREEARELALKWKENLLEHTAYPLVTSGFLLFVCAYGLTLDFDPDELRTLYQSIATLRHSPELYQALCVSEDIAENNSFDQSAPKDMRLSNKVTTVSTSNMDGMSDPIRYASNPAQLVLDAVEGCYYSMLEHRTISKIKVLRNISFLLSRLLRIPLDLKPQVKDQAKKFAVYWKEKIKRYDAIEVGCLLLFVVTYNVDSSFHVGEILSFMDVVCNRGAENNLFHSLGLAHELPYFIRILVEKRKHLDAIKCVYAFELFDKFSPITLLEDYIRNANSEAEKIREEGHNSVDAREIATKLQVKAFNAAMKCTRLHGLELQEPFKNLEALTEALEMQLVDPVKLNKNKGKRFLARDLASKTESESRHSKKLQRAAQTTEATSDEFSGGTFHSFSHQPTGEFPVEPTFYPQLAMGSPHQSLPADDFSTIFPGYESPEEPPGYEILLRSPDYHP